MASKKDFPHTTEVANRYGTEAVKQMKRRLKEEDKDGGELEKSIRFKLVYTEQGIEVKFFMSKTADYVEQGRKAYGDDRSHDPPVVKGWGRSNLKAWMARKGMDEDYKYALARSIGRHGISPFKFRFVTITLWNQYQQRYKTALAKDYELQLQRFVKEELAKAKK